jgi:Carnitine deficiency-associated protein 3
MFKLKRVNIKNNFLFNSNLKLGQLNLDDENNRENQSGNDYDENYLNDGENSEENPWKKANAAAAAPAPAPRPEVQQKSTGAYVPRHLQEVRKFCYCLVTRWNS